MWFLCRLFPLEQSQLFQTTCDRPEEAQFILNFSLFLANMWFIISIIQHSKIRSQIYWFWYWYWLQGMPNKTRHFRIDIDTDLWNRSAWDGQYQISNVKCKVFQMEPVSSGLAISRAHPKGDTNPVWGEARLKMLWSKYHRLSGNQPKCKTFWSKST